MSSGVALFVEVLLPLPLNQTFTYEVPEASKTEVVLGSRVVVQLGGRKLYTGIVTEIHDRVQDVYHVKPFLELLDQTPLVLEQQLRLWDWMASYYMCSSGEVMKAAMPSGLKLESETQVLLCENFQAEGVLSEKENKLLQVLIPGKSVTLQDLVKTTGWSRLLPVVQHLVEMGAVEISEGLRETYKEKTKTFVRLNSNFQDSSDLVVKALEELSRAKKQSELFTYFLKLSGFLDGEGSAPIEKKELLESALSSPAILKALVDKGLLECFEQAVNRLEQQEASLFAPYTLNGGQREALQSIQASFCSRPVCLLNGQTSSGKTEVYIHLIQEYLNEGKQVLYLVPEIALTSQLSGRLWRVFGKKLGVYHSKYSDAERVEVWTKMLGNDPYQVVLGARSSLFLPFRNLGLVIIDEEHENSFKQQDPSPRYHARSSAIMLASFHHAKTLLGTATPSMETYFNVETGKYGVVELKGRFLEMPLPEVEVVNTRELRRKKRMKGLFSPILKEKMEYALNNGEQIILFQNRRGYAPILECRDCGWIPKCERCDVSLTYHKNTGKLTCHYCGFERQMPDVCPSCGSDSMKLVGVGTEQVEEEVKRLFPEARVGRMDTDTTRSRRSHEQIIEDFEMGRTNILIGTQMVSKGLDFKHVRVVGILDADQMLNFPDFRAHERSFQLMVQVSGRAGRQGKQGMVILQTSNPDLPVIKEVLRNDFDAFFRRESEMRQMFGYPPFTRMILIRLRHKDPDVVERAAWRFSQLLFPYFQSRMLGPDKPMISKINHYHYRQLILKAELSVSSIKVKDLLLKAQEEMYQERAYKSVQVLYDVDPA